LISKAGRTFAARLGASILTAAGLPELIVEDTASYEELAIRIANSPVEQARLKSKLNDAREISPLWDAEGYRRSVEDAYLQMWSRFRAGEPPQSFEARDVVT
jgi:predicted O-linked N-acetylglucosamine transferase (SPINDLY family)